MGRILLKLIMCAAFASALVHFMTPLSLPAEHHQHPIMRGPFPPTCPRDVSRPPATSLPGKPRPYVHLGYTWEPFTGSLKSFIQLAALVASINGTLIVPHAFDGCFCGFNTSYRVCQDGCARPPISENVTDTRMHPLSHYIDLGAFLSRQFKDLSYLHLDEYLTLSPTPEIDYGINFLYPQFAKAVPHDQCAPSVGSQSLKVIKEFAKMGISVKNITCARAGNARLPDYALRSNAILLLNWRGSGERYRTALPSPKTLYKILGSVPIACPIRQTADAFLASKFGFESSFCLAHLRFGKLMYFANITTGVYLRAVLRVAQRLNSFTEDMNCSRLVLATDLDRRSDVPLQTSPLPKREMKQLLMSRIKVSHIEEYEPSGEILTADGSGGLTAYVEAAFGERASAFFTAGRSAYGDFVSRHARPNNVRRIMRARSSVDFFKFVHGLIE